MHLQRVLACALGAICLAVLQPSAALATDFGEHGNEPFAWIHSGGYYTSGPDKVLFDEAHFSWAWGPTVVGLTYALGDIRASDYGTHRARSTLYYHDPFGSGALSIGADVTTWRPFIVSSDTLPLGTNVDVTLTIGYAGSFQVREQAAEKSSTARADGVTTLYNNVGTVLAQRMGEASVNCALTSTGRQYTVATFDDWDGCLTEAVDDNGDPIYQLAYQEAIDFTATVGGKYWLYFDLATSANASAGSGLGWGGSQTFVQADFANTGSYELSSAADITFVTVPEPTAAALLALSGLLLRARRRGI